MDIRSFREIGLKSPNAVEPSGGKMNLIHGSWSIKTRLLVARFRTEPRSADFCSQSSGCGSLVTSL